MGLSTPEEDSFQWTDCMVSGQSEWNSSSEANDLSISSTPVCDKKKSIWFIYFNRQQSSTGDRTKDQWTKSAFIKQLYTTTDRSLFWDHTVYYMYISYVNSTLNYYLRDISQIPYNNSPVIRNKLQTWMK